MKTITTTSAILISLAWRTIIAISTQTFFQPDEFFQSLEVAHHAVFGYGHLTWEWMTDPPIRSVFFPALYVPVYWILNAFGWDSGDALIIAPKILQGAIAAITDISTRELARKLLGDRYSDTAFILSLSSLFHILALSRTLSNSVETSFTAAALCFWPWDSKGSYKQLQLAFALAALSCLVRPTSVVLWAFLFSELLWRARPNTRHLRTVFITGLLTLLFTAGCLVFVDSLYFGKPTFTPWNFVLTNLSSVSLHYGQAPWHYYFTQGFPILLNFYLPSAILGAWNIHRSGLKHQRTALALVYWTIFVYSLLGHKEWRFLHPVLPLMIVLSAKSLVDNTGKVDEKEETSQRSSQSLARSKSRSSIGYKTKVKVICGLGLLPGLYVTRIHGSAQISVLFYLRSLDTSVLHSIGFLMPCHSTPWQAYLHKPELAESEGLIWGLSCEPPLHGVNISTYMDQTDVFYASPLTYLKQHFPSSVDQSFPPSPYPSTPPGVPQYSPSPPSSSSNTTTDTHNSTLINKWRHEWPSHLIFFGALLETETKDRQEGKEIEEYLEGMGYDEVWTSKWNGFEGDWRRKGGVKVWAWQGNE